MLSQQIERNSLLRDIPYSGWITSEPRAKLQEGVQGARFQMLDILD